MTTTINASTSSGLVNTADTSGVLQLQTASTAAVTINASQQVGIGTASPTNALSVNTSSTSDGLAIGQGGTVLTTITSNGGDTNITSTNALVLKATGSNIQQFYTNATERMRISSAGYVGIGVTNPTQPLQISGGIATEVDLFVSGTRTGTFYVDNSQMLIDAVTAIPMIFRTADTERMRIDSSGRVCIGVNSAAYSTACAMNVNVDTVSASGGAWVSKAASTSTAFHMNFQNGNGGVGGISTSGSATQYVTSSDYRLKENITPMTGALAKVAQLKPVTYKWKVDGSNGEGFIAHELAEVKPDCVSGDKDAVDADGNPKYQGVDTSFLVATLTAAIQEQQALITNLTTRLAALEGAK